MIKKSIRRLLKTLGYTLVKTDALPPDITLSMEPDFLSIYEKCKKFSMTGIEAMYSLYKAVEFIVKNDVKGDFIECGVWKGGSMMLVAYTLMHFKKTNRHLFLYDTFEGMSLPSNQDEDLLGRKAMDTWNIHKKEKHNEWCLSTLKDTQKNILSTGYPEKKIVFVKGKVEETIPAHLPEEAALIRLDTDWFESTYHELQFLFPKLNRHGVLIIDDYGHWKGSKTATDQYLSESNVKMMLNRVDYSVRMGIKLS